MTTILTAPPYIDWNRWISRELRTQRQGVHKMFCGPTQSGKTTLCRIELRGLKFVIVFGTKPKQNDPAIRRYITTEGYRLIESWPPKSADLRPDSNGNVHLLLWPYMKEYKDLTKHREMYRKCLQDCFVDGKWAFGIDETYWMCSAQGLGLRDIIEAVAFGGAADGLSLYMCLQRPAGIPRLTWSSISQAYLFKMGVTSDLREMAALGTEDPRDVVAAIKSLKPFSFLSLPTRAQARWAISTIDPGWA